MYLGSKTLIYNNILILVLVLRFRLYCKVVPTHAIHNILTRTRLCETLRAV